VWLTTYRNKVPPPYCVNLNGEDLSRYSKKTESVYELVEENVRIITILLVK